MSEKWSLDREDWRKIGKGAVVALCGAGIVFLGNLAGMDFGSWTPVVAALSGVGVNALKKWSSDGAK